MVTSDTFFSWLFDLWFSGTYKALQVQLSESQLHLCTATQVYVCKATRGGYTLKITARVRNSRYQQGLKGPFPFYLSRRTRS